MSRSATPQKDMKSGSWWFVVDLGPGTGPSGEWQERRQAKRRGFPTKRAAQEAMDELRVSVRHQTYIAPKDLTFGEFLDDWLAAVKPKLEATTHEGYERNLRLHVKPALGSVRLQQLDGAMLNRHYGVLLVDGRSNGKGGLSLRSVRNIHTIIGAAMTTAVKWELIARNPADAAEPPSARRAKGSAMKTWEATMLRRFLAAEEGDRYHPIWVFLATTGCRRGEALGLRWGDVDLDARTATIRQTITAIKGRVHRSPTTKTDKPRVIRLDPTTVRVLRAWKARQASEKLALGDDYAGEDLVFSLADGRPHNPNTLSWMFDQRVKRHRAPRIRLHDLRHTWATLALADGIHPRIVQERLGHSSVSVTLDIYSHVTPGLESDAADRIARLIFGA